MASPWAPPPFTPTGVCTCTPRHSPRLMVIEDHHIEPLSWGGPDVAANKVRVCPNTHYGTHALLNEYVRHKGAPPPTIVTLYTKPAQLLASMAWKLRDPSHPTPYWMPAAAPIHVEEIDGVSRVAEMMRWPEATVPRA